MKRASASLHCRDMSRLACKSSAFTRTQSTAHFNLWSERPVISSIAHKKKSGRSIHSGLSVLGIRSCTTFAHSRSYTTTSLKSTTEAQEGIEIKEVTSPVFYERRIKDLFNGAERNIDEEGWTKAEDRLFTILDTSEQLKKTLQEQGKDESKNKYLSDEFLGRVHVRLAFAQHNQGKRDYADEHYSTGITLLRSGLGADHHEVAHALMNQAEVLSLLSRVEEAEAKLREALPALRKAHGTEHEIVAGALSNLAGILCGQGKFSEAVAPNEEALQILDKVLGTDNEYTLSTLANCLKMYEELDNKEGIARLRARYDEKHAEFMLMNKKNEDYSQEEVNKIAQEWEREGARKILDPTGMYKDAKFHRDELRAFMNVWRNQMGRRVSDNEMEVLLKELDGMSDEKLQKLGRIEPNKLLESLRQLRNAAPEPGSEAWRDISNERITFETDDKEEGVDKEVKETVAEEDSSDFAYDEDRKAKEGRGRGRRQTSRRKAKSFENALEKELKPNEMTDKEMEENEAHVHRKASATSSLSPDILKMMDTEEQLTSNQLQREAEKRK